MLSKGIVSSLPIAKVLKVTSPTLDHFVQTYEEKLLQVVALSENQRLSEAFQIKSFSQEIEIICKKLLLGRGQKIEK
ncbi:opine metallophore biosynthesis dehydrogenase [Lysinibacillus sp. OL1_EC]|nr:MULTISPECIES: opine metallophore biosynthesis dehydrogenase [unclassified Lysinibacillus]TBV90167.1 DUF2338 family protein [Lysinibacillus sp. OL1]MCM0623572.1 opine metallophore biosynthesis dehydrogenase [Lysinibacillus sp. OL1_EC]MCS5500348.1 opine metallophore biosynthesis dehydrogenase [Lysinibacillus sp. A4]UKJ47629.1 opine metallophore biosynthesis dehydrogenase [Lysinibacillus sp. ACHW1.5]WGT41776.1 opine metallophore biosynthesis dehydrogenase [Lysinibacillus sp. 1 U-2021]